MLARLWAFLRRFSEDGYDEQCAIESLFDYIDGVLVFAPPFQRVRLASLRKRLEGIGGDARERFRRSLHVVHGRLCGSADAKATLDRYPWPRNYRREHDERVERAKERAASEYSEVERVRKQAARDLNLVLGLSVLDNEKKGSPTAANAIPADIAPASAVDEALANLGALVGNGKPDAPTPSK